MAKGRKTGGKTKAKPDTYLRKDWQDYILGIMSEGASLAEVKGDLAISNDLHTRWIKEEPVYSETIKKGLGFSQAWWEREGRENLRNKNFSYVGWYMNMKNRFGWKDRQDYTSGDKPLPKPIMEIPNGIPKNNGNQETPNTK